MATDTEPPPVAPLPPWRQELLLLRRREGRPRDGRLVPVARPTTAPPPPPSRRPTPATRSVGAGAGADTDTDPHPPSTSRYIDAFGEIVGLPSPRSACDEPADPSAAGGDLQYGPGIVSRLRSRYLSMARRETSASAEDLRRAASLQDLLRREGALERGALQDSYLLAGAGAPSAPAAWAQSIRKAKSVGDLVSPPPPPPPAEADEDTDGPRPADRVRLRHAPAEGIRSGWRPPDGRTAVATGKTVTVETGGAAEKAVRPGGVKERRPSATPGEKTSVVGSNRVSEKAGSANAVDWKALSVQKKPVAGPRNFEKTLESEKRQKAPVVKLSGTKPPVTSKEAAETTSRSNGSKIPVVKPRQKTPELTQGSHTPRNGTTSRPYKPPIAAVKPATIRTSPDVTEKSVPAEDRSSSPSVRSASPTAAMKADAGGPLIVPQPMQDSLPSRKSSLPTTDTVSVVKRMFEPASGVGGGGPVPEKGVAGGTGGGGRPVVATSSTDAVQARGSEVASAAAAARLATAADGEVNSVPSQVLPTELDPRPATNGHAPPWAGRPAVNGRPHTPPLKARDMVGVILNGGRSGRRAEKPLLPTSRGGSVTGGAPVTRASLAAAMKHSTAPVLAADSGRISPAQAVNARLLSTDNGPAPGQTPTQAPPAPPTAQTVSWHQRVNNSTLYNFTDRGEVPDYIEDDGMDIHRPAKPKPSDPGFVLLPGFEPGSTSDEDLLPPLVPPQQLQEPPVCPVTFSNDGVIINGRSSLLRQHKESTRAVWFSELSPRVFRYPSEASLLETEPPEPEQEQDQRYQDQMVSSDDDWEESGDRRERPASSPRLADPAPSADLNAKPSTLSTYTSSRLAADEAAAFQLGVTRIVRPPAPSAPPPPPPAADPQPEPEDEETAWSAEATADMLF